MPEQRRRKNFRLVTPRLLLIGLAIAGLALVATSTLGAASCPIDPPPPECDNGGQFPGGRWDLSQISGSYSLSGSERYYPFIDDLEVYDDYDVEGELTVSMLGGAEENYVDVGCDGTVTGQGREQLTGTVTKTPNLKFYDPEFCFGEPQTMNWTVTIERTYSITGTVTGSGQLDLDLTVDQATLDFSGSLAVSFDCIFIGGSDSFSAFDLSGDTESVRFSGPIQPSSTSWSPTITPRGSKTWVDDILHRLEMNQMDDGSEGSITIDPSLAGAGSSQPAIQLYGEYFIQDATGVTENLNANAEPKTPIITSLTLDEPSQYLEGVAASTTLTAEVDWRGQSPGQVEFTYGGTTETVGGGASVTWTFDAGEAATTIRAEAIQGDERSQPYIVNTPKVSVPGWAGTSADWSGSSGVHYEATLDWPVSLETTRTLDTISLFSGLWGITGSASSTFKAMAQSSGSPGSGDMTTSADVQFAGKSASLMMAGPNMTTLACDDLTTTGSATAELPVTLWKKTLNPVTLVPGIQAGACALSGFLCDVIQSVGIKASADATLTGTPTYTGEGAEIRWDGGSLGGSLSGRIGAGVSLPPPIASVANVSVSGGGTGCIDFQVSPDLQLQTLGGQLEASASANFFGLSASAEETWPFGDGCGALFFGKSLENPPEAVSDGGGTAFVPADGQLAMDALWVEDPGGGEILGVAAWSELPAGQSRPSGDIAVRFFAESAWGSTLMLTADIESDLSPTVAFDGEGRALIVYARSSEMLPTEVADLPAFANGYDLHWASVDPSTATIVASGQLTHLVGHDFGPRLRRDASGGLHVFWQQADGVEITGSAASPVSIRTASWQASTSSWSPEQVVAAGLEKTLGFSPAVLSASVGLVALVVDEDGDFTTAADREIYEISEQAGTWLAPRRVTDDVLRDDAPQAAFSSGDALLLWRQEEQILELRGDLFAAPTAAFEDPNALAGEPLDGAFAHGRILETAGVDLVIWNEGESLHLSTHAPAGSWSPPARALSGAGAESLAVITTAGDEFALVGYGVRSFEAGNVALSPLVEPRFERIVILPQLFADDFESGDASAWTATSP